MAWLFAFHSKVGLEVPKFQKLFYSLQNDFQSGKNIREALSDQLMKNELPYTQQQQ